MLIRFKANVSGSSTEDDVADYKASGHVCHAMRLIQPSNMNVFFLIRKHNFTEYSQSNM